MSVHHGVINFNMAMWLGKQTLDFCQSFVRLSKHMDVPYIYINPQV